MATKITKNKIIVLPINEAIYEDCLRKRPLAHELIKDIYEVEPDLFPIEIENKNGYNLNGFTRISKKQEGFQMRQIIIGFDNYRIRPSFMLPYCNLNFRLELIITLC
jgi:hypothetical protein